MKKYSIYLFHHMETAEVERIWESLTLSEGGGDWAVFSHEKPDDWVGILKAVGLERVGECPDWKAFEVAKRFRDEIMTHILEGDAGVLAEADYRAFWKKELLQELEAIAWFDRRLDDEEAKDYLETYGKAIPRGHYSEIRQEIETRYLKRKKQLPVKVLKKLAAWHALGSMIPKTKEGKENDGFWQSYEWKFILSKFEKQIQTYMGIYKGRNAGEILEELLNVKYMYFQEGEVSYNMNRLFLSLPGCLWG